MDNNLNNNNINNNNTNINSTQPLNETATPINNINVNEILNTNIDNNSQVVAPVAENTVSPVNNLNVNEILNTDVSSINSNVNTPVQLLDNSTVDYNSLYNINNTQVQQYNNQIEAIDQKIAEEQIINPEVTSLEKVNTESSVNTDDNKGLTFIIIITVIILAIIIFLFPFLAKRNF